MGKIARATRSWRISAVLRGVGQCANTSQEATEQVLTAMPLFVEFTGKSDWATFNPTTKARARGSAHYEYGVQWTADGPRIVSEASKVVRRETLTSPPPNRGEGWWVVLGSFRVDSSAGSSVVESSVSQITGAAFLCGYDASNDLSSKFGGLAPGYRVVVLGSFRDKATADRARQDVGRCVPDAYVKRSAFAAQN